MVGVVVGQAAEFDARWQGTGRWTGSEHWASPIYDWEVRDGSLVGRGYKGRLLQRLTERVEQPGKGFELRTSVGFLHEGGLSMPERVRAGFAIGIQGMMDNPTHVAVLAKSWHKAGIRADGKLFIDDEISKQVLGGNGAVDLVLSYDGKAARVVAERGGKSVELMSEIASGELKGNIGLAADSPRKRSDKRGPIEMSFGSWSGSGDGLVSDPSLAFGPVLWTQYTRQGNTVKVTAQMPPVTGEVVLEARKGDGWKELSRGAIDPLSRTATFKAEVSEGAVDYRVRYDWQGKDHTWEGTFAADPGPEVPLKVAAFSCDHGYAFPLPKMVANVAVQKPDLMFFAGDQIYEVYGGFGIVRSPVETAMLDYLRKFYQFGWTWRELLKDVPSIIIPDDHDVFQGNLWGGGGRKVKNMTAGGYVMPPEWVNAVERTQTAHLPDPVDPRPIGQGIGVYFTEMTWGGVPMAVIEDRKFKSGPDSVLPKDVRKAGDPKNYDVKGAQLLGARQEKFLHDWGKRTADEPLRLVLSQTIFCRASTHTGQSLKRTKFDCDSNGWPQSGRRRALEALRGDNTVMLAGDQHFGMLARQGIDKHGDGPWSFMVPGTANGFPRAWWPEGDKVTGDFLDGFGNKFTVLAAANPEKGSNELEPRAKDDPETTAHKKGSGYGILVAEPGRKKLRFEMWRYDFDAGKPEKGDQFEGFPVEVGMGR